MGCLSTFLHSISVNHVLTSLQRPGSLCDSATDGNITSLTLLELLLMYISLLSFLAFFVSQTLSVAWHSQITVFQLFSVKGVKGYEGNYQ